MERLAMNFDKIFSLIIPIALPFIIGAGLTAKYMGNQFRKKLSYIREGLMRSLERDKTERSLDVDIYIGRRYESEKWIEEFLKKVNSGEIEIIWASLK